MNSRQKAQIAAVVMAALFALSFLRFTEPVHPRYDAGAYIIAAKALGAGMGLVHLAHPENPPFTTYPPVIPVMLAPFANIASTGFIGLKAEMIFFFWLVLIAFFLAFRKYLEGWRSYFALGVLGTGTLLAFAGRLQGEVPFTLFIVLTLYFADRFFKSVRKRDLVLMLVFLALLCFSRQAGIAFTAGCILALLIAPLADGPKKKQWTLRFVAIVIIIAAIIIPWALMIHSIQPGSLTPDSSSMLRVEGWDPAQGRISLMSRSMLGRLKMNLVASVSYLPESLFYTYELSKRPYSKILLAPLFVLILIGFVRRAIKKRSVLETCTLTYTGLIFITPWLRGPRFFTVMLPVALIYMSEGVDAIAGFVLRHRRNEYVNKVAATAFCALCAFIIAGNLYGFAADDQVNPWSANGNPDYELAMFAGPYLASDEVVLAHDHCAFYLLTGNKSLSYTPAEQKFLAPYKLNAYLNKGGRVDYIAWAQGDETLVETFLRDYGFEVKEIAAAGPYHLERIMVKTATAQKGD